MGLILNIETSTRVCSVCIAKDGKLVGIKESEEEKSHAKKLTGFIDELLKEHGYAYKDLDAIAVDKGPGSYTGLRIGVSTAKGLCYAIERPLIAINTLQSMAIGVINKVQEKSFLMDDFEDVMLVPMIDARRMEVYSAFFNSDGDFKREVKAEIIDEDSYQTELKSRKMLFFGDGSEKIHKVVNHDNAVFLENMEPSSKDMIMLSEKKFQNKDFEDVAYFEPFYLKDFVATVPKKNIFN